MGLFDTIRSEYPLPLPEEPKGYLGSNSFQTKDLENSLSTFVLDKEGQLWEEKAEYEHVPGDPKAKDWLERLGENRVVREWREKRTDTCEILMYDYVNSKDKEYDYEIDYFLVFKEGKLDSAKIHRFCAENNAERKRRDAEFEERWRRTLEYRKLKRYKYFVGPYNAAVNKAFFLLHKAFQKINNNLWRIENSLKIDR